MVAVPAMNNDLPFNIRQSSSLAIFNKVVNDDNLEISDM